MYSFGKVIFVAATGSAAASMALAVSPAIAATELFVGPSASYGQAVPAGAGSGNSRADGLAGLTYVFGYGLYTAPSAETITLNAVNFANQSAGSIIPFVAEYLGGSLSSGNSYSVLLTGDSFTVPAGSSSGVLENEAFEVGGVNPTLSLTAGEVLVAGVYQSGQNVVFQSADGSPAIIYGGDAIPLAGQTFGNPNYAFSNQNYRYDIGFTAVSGSIPEPGAWALMISGLAMTGATLRLGRPRRLVA